MRPLAKKLYSYRWELWLFILVPYIVNALYSPLYKVIPNPDLEQAQVIVSMSYLALLVLSYTRVRWLPRPFLVAFLQFLMLADAVRIFVRTVTYTLFYDDNGSIQDGALQTVLFYFLMAALLVSTVVLLIGFGRRLSRAGMGRVVMLMVLQGIWAINVAFGFSFTEFSFSPATQGLIGAMKPLIYGLVLAWLVHRIDNEPALSMRQLLGGLAIVQSAYLLFVAYVYAARYYDGWDMELLLLSLYWYSMSPFVVLIHLGVLLGVYIWLKLKPPEPLAPIFPQPPENPVTGPQHPVPVKQ